jgi:hypothetical protein
MQELEKRVAKLALLWCQQLIPEKGRRKLEN